MNNIKDIAQQNSKIGAFWWVLFCAVIVAGIAANYYYSDVAWALRAAAAIVIICVAVLIALQTAMGKSIWQFAKASRMELRKVVWPTRQETVQTTMIVIIMVVVVSLLLWGVDSILMWAVSWLTGSRG